MTRSGEISRAIYERLGPMGLAARTRPEWDRKTIDLVRSTLPDRGRILDLGCGYGRIAIPLIEAGFDVVGLDISPLMLAEAERRAEAAGVAATWIEGDLCHVPYGDASFDAVLCLWLTFHELLERPEQLAALNEIRRLVRPGGVALLDGPPYHDTDQETEADDQPSFPQLMASAGITRYQLFVDDCPGRPRQFLRLQL